MEKLLLAGLVGAALGAGVAYVLVVEGCKQRIVAGAQGAVASLGGDFTVQALAGQAVRAVVDAQ